jgi:hypothetical protein
MDHADRKLDERETDQVAYHHLRHAIAIGPPLQFFTYTQMKEAQRKTSKKLGEILSRGIRKAGDRRVWPFRRVRFRRSHDFQALQISDERINRG